MVGNNQGCDDDVLKDITTPTDVSQKERLSPDTPVNGVCPNVGFSLPGVLQLHDQSELIFRSIKTDCTYQKGGEKNVRGWEEILKAVDMVKQNVHSWHSQADKLEATIAMLDAGVDDTMSENKMLNEKNQDLAMQLSSLQLDVKTHQAESRMLREAVESLKRTRVSEEYARRRQEQIHESKELEWMSIKARQQMEIELCKGALTIQKDAESLLKEEHAKKIEFLQCALDAKSVEIEKNKRRIEEVKSSNSLLAQEVQDIHLNAQKQHQDGMNAQRKNTALSEQLEWLQRSHENDLKRIQEVLDAQKNAHQACLQMKDMEITSLKELNNSVQGEYESKFSCQESQKEALETALSEKKVQYDSIFKKYEEQSRLLTEVQSHHETLKSKFDELGHTLNVLQESEIQHVKKQNELEKHLQDQRETCDSMEKNMRQQLEQAVAKSIALEASKSLVDTQLAETSEKYNALVKSHETLQKDHSDLLNRQDPKPETDTPAVHPAAKRVLQKRMKVTQRKTSLQEDK